jgi:excisionase family DNA binding protein
MKGKDAAKTPRDTEPVMTVRELSAYLHVHTSTIYKLLKRNQIPAFHIWGSYWRFNVEEIDRWLLSTSRVPSRTRKLGSNFLANS